MGLSELKMGVSRAASVWRILASVFPCLFQLLEVPSFLGSQVLPPPSEPPVPAESFSCGHLFGLTLLPPPSTCNAPVITLGPPEWPRIMSPYQGPSRNHIAAPFGMWGNARMGPGIRSWLCWGVFYFLPSTSIIQMLQESVWAGAESLIRLSPTVIMPAHSSLAWCDPFIRVVSGRRDFRCPWFTYGFSSHRSRNPTDTGCAGLCTFNLLPCLSSTFGVSV